MGVIIKDLGAVTAYAYAVIGGYVGTEAEFEALLGNIAEDLSNIENLQVIANGLPAGSSPTASYSDGVLTLGIPKGDKGDTGDGIAHVNISTLPEGSSATASYNAATETLSLGIPVGATGATGNGIQSIYKTGTTGNVDEYTILYTDGNTDTFTVTNGNVSSVAGKTGAVTLDADDVAYDETDTYSEGTVGEAITNVNGALSQLSDTKAPAIFEETSGSIARIEDGADSMPIKSLVVNIEPVQSGSGDPSPTNIRTISGWTGANIAHTGKNIAKLNYVSSSGSVQQSGLTDNSVTVSNEAKSTTAYRYARYILCPLKMLRGKKITFSATAVNNSGPSVPRTILRMVNTDYSTYGSSIIEATTLTISKTTTIPSDAPEDGWLMIYLYSASNTSDAESKTWSNIQIEVSDTQTDFEPYNGTTKALTWQTEAGTVYGGYVDAIRGKLVATHAKIDLGDKFYVASDTNTADVYRMVSSSAVSGIKVPSATDVAANIICDTYKTQKADRVYSLNQGISILSTGKIAIYDPNYNASDSPSGFKSFVTGSYMVYELATPIEYDIESIDGLETIFGVNNIFADCGSIKSVLYPADTKLYIDSALGTNEDNLIADAPITSGTVFSTGSRVFKATANISAGETISPGTNCTETDIIAQINALYALV